MVCFSASPLFRFSLFDNTNTTDSRSACDRSVSGALYLPPLALSTLLCAADQRKPSTHPFFLSLQVRRPRLGPTLLYPLHGCHELVLRVRSLPPSRPFLPLLSPSLPLCTVPPSFPPTISLDLLHPTSSLPPRRTHYPFPARLADLFPIFLLPPQNSLWDVADDAFFAKQNPCCPALMWNQTRILGPGLWTLIWFLISFILFIGFILAALATWKQSPHAMYCQAQTFLPCVLSLPPSCSSRVLTSSSFAELVDFPFSHRPYSSSLAQSTDSVPFLYRL
jgi:hypothetical protein